MKSLQKILSFLKKNKVPLLILTPISIAIIGLVVALLVISPEIYVSQMQKPQIETTEQQLVNTKNFKITSKNTTGLFTKNGNKSFIANGSELTITDIAEGKQKFEIHQAINFFLFKVISTDSVVVEKEFDFTPLSFANASQFLKDYSTPKITVNFETDETPSKSIVSFDGTEKEVTCTKEKDTKKYSCELAFEKEGTQHLDFYLTDNAGNKSFIVQNFEFTYTLPITLTCTNIPTLTNAKSIDAKCTSNKDGSYKIGDTTAVDITAGKEVTIPMNLPTEGDNKILVKLTAKDGKQFDQTFTIKRDTTAPAISIKLPYLDFYSSSENIPISLSFNENVTGTYTFRAYDSHPISGTTYKETYKKTLNLNAGEKFSITHNSSNYKVCRNGYCIGVLEFYIAIDVQDAAGNKFSKTYIVAYQNSPHD